MANIFITTITVWICCSVIGALTLCGRIWVNWLGQWRFRINSFIWYYRFRNRRLRLRIRFRINSFIWYYRFGLWYYRRGIIIVLTSTACAAHITRYKVSIIVISTPSIFVTPISSTAITIWICCGAIGVCAVCVWLWCRRIWSRINRDFRNPSSNESCACCIPTGHIAQTIASAVFIKGNIKLRVGAYAAEILAEGSELANIDQTIRARNSIELSFASSICWLRSRSWIISISRLPVFVYDIQAKRLPFLSGHTAISASKVSKCLLPFSLGPGCGISMR